MRSICIIGPMLGDSQKYKPTPGETLAFFLRASGYSITEVSNQKNRYLRLFDILWSIWKQNKQIDLLIIQIYGYRSFVVEDLASNLGKTLGIPIIMVLHGGTLPKMATSNPNWVKRVLSRSDALIAPSNFLRRELSNLGLEIQIIPNIIDIALYPYKLRSFVNPSLFWMRSFEWYYNPSLALRVFKRLSAKYPDARLTMAGPDFGLLKNIQKEAIAMDINKMVKFTGMLSFEDKIQYVNRHDIFLNTNIIDNMPVTLIEMAAFGLPIISTSVGGIPDLLKQRSTGLLVNDNDDKAMAEAIIELIENPGLAQKLSSQGRELSLNFSWEKTKPKWISAIESISK